MLLSYLKLTFRLLTRNIFFSTINLVSLSVGFAAFLVLWPYSHYELGTDKWHRDFDKIARISIQLAWTDDNQNWSSWKSGNTMAGVATHVKESFGEVSDVTRFIPQANFKEKFQGSGPNVLITIVDDDERRVFKESGTAYADPNFFQFFSFPISTGDASDVLSEPFSAVISEHHAKKYFGKENPVDKVIYLNDTLPLTVKGVFKDVPRNSHLSFDLLISTAGARNIDLLPPLDAIPTFDWFGYCYIKVRDDLASFSGQFDKRHDDIFPARTGRVRVTNYLQPLADIAFERLRDVNANVKSKSPLLLLRAMSFVILILAWVNYVSLAIGKLHQRLSEFGTRKTIGAETRHFIAQFFVDAAVVNGIAFLLGATIVQIAAPLFARLLGFYNVPWTELSGGSLLLIAAVFLAGILVTGLYPVWLCASRTPQELLKKLLTSKKPFWLNGIVTTQYTAAIILMICVAAAYSQLNHIFNRDLGIVSDEIIVISCPVKKPANFESKLVELRQATEKLNGVKTATTCHDLPGAGTAGLYVRKNESSNEMALDTNGAVDEHFLATFGIRLVAGRNFRDNMPADRTSVLISEDAVKRIGFDSLDDAIGRKLTLPWSGNKVVEVIGVYQDYEFRPFYVGSREDGRGSVLTYGNDLDQGLAPEKMALKVDMTNYRSVVAEAETLFRQSFPDEPFEWSFMDENIQQHYLADKIARNQISMFTFIAVLIACLGLLGMITMKTGEKTKEIGIRKVLGARHYHIVRILLSSTVVQLGIATIVGIPVSARLITEYLEKFSDRINIEWWHYALPVATLLLIMSATVIFIIRKAIHENPVQCLRYE